MNKHFISGAMLIALGFPQGKVIGITIKVVEKRFKKKKREEVVEILKNVLTVPEKYIEYKILSPIADELIVKPEMRDGLPLVGVCNFKKNRSYKLP